MKHQITVLVVVVSWDEVVVMVKDLPFCCYDA
jgi:hypothetical protein